VRMARSRHGGRELVSDSAGVLVRVGGVDRRRGNFERDPCLQEARTEECGRDAHVDGDHPGRAVLRHYGTGTSTWSAALGRDLGAGADREDRLWRWHHLLYDPGVYGAHSLPCREYGVRR